MICLLWLQWGSVCVYVCVCAFARVHASGLQNYCSLCVSINENYINTWTL